MRIIGEFDLEDIKVTVFKMNEKLSIKFEKSLIEQIIKFRDGSGVNTLEEAKSFCNADILGAIKSSFEALNQSRYQSILEMQGSKEDDFEDII